MPSSAATEYNSGVVCEQEALQQRVREVEIAHVDDSRAVLEDTVCFPSWSSEAMLNGMHCRVLCRSRLHDTVSPIMGPSSSALLSTKFRPFQAFKDTWCL